MVHEFLVKLDSTLFGVLMAFIYLVLKVLIKGGIRKSVAGDYDFMEMTAWFGVDLVFLVIGASISMNLPMRLRFSQYDNGIAAWYTALMLLLFVCLGLYTFHWWWRKNKRRYLPPFCALLSLVSGAAPFLYTLSLLPQGT